MLTIYIITTSSFNSYSRNFNSLKDFNKINKNKIKQINFKNIVFYFFIS